MSRPRSVPITFGFGLADRVDPKLAPFGVLKVGKNLRIRKDGRLGPRLGYRPLPDETGNGTLHAYDLHEYRGRLVAYGSDTDDGYPTDLFEYVDSYLAQWRGCDATASRVVLNPFTNPREVGGLPQPGDGITSFDAAIGGGLLCLVYNVGFNTFDGYVALVNVANDQVVHHQRIGSVSFNSARVAYAGDTFYIAGLNGPTNVVVYSYQVGVSTAFASFLVDGSMVGVTAFDMCAVTNPTTTARIALAIDRQAGNDLLVKVYNAAGAQVGSTCTVTGIATSRIAIEADQADDTINLFTVAAGVGELRTFNFSGTLLDGPTATTAGSVGGICRLPAQGSFTEHVAVAVSDASDSVVVQYFDVDTHAVTDTATVQQALLVTKPVSGQSENQPMAVVFAAVIGHDLSQTDGLTNGLFFVTPDCAHMATRDLARAMRDSSVRLNTLSHDATTGQLCWLGQYDAGGVLFPSITVVDFQSDERRQTVPFGGLLYSAGATPLAYDGRFPVPLNFAELPGIASATAGSSGGDLAASATYSYVVHWEYVLADGSVIVGPVSEPVQVSTGASDNRVTLTVATPHTVAIALGDALYGANVSAVVSRTVWEPLARIEGSVFRRCVVEPVTVGMADYGALLTVVDTTSDTDLADEAPVYTQGERGPISAPLQHFAPLGCEHITATEARLMTGGLARSFDVQISKAAYLGEAFEFSPLSPYFATVAGPVRGVRYLDGVKLVFTSDRIYAIGGDGPDDIGAGALDYPREIPAPSGLSDPWSFLDAPDGLWFQVDDAKLFRIPRGGGAPTWEGVDVQDTLREFYEIVGAAKCKADNAALFACNKTSLDTRIIVRDFRTEQWFVDEVPHGTSDIDALTSWGATVAYAAGGRVWAQETTAAVGYWDVDVPDDETALHIETQATTHPLYPFGLGGYGQIHEVLLTGELLGVCVLNARVSYDDGQTYTDLESFDLAGDVAFGTIQRKWTLPQDVTSSVVFEFTVTAFEGTLSQGFVFNQIDLLVETEPGLRELRPDEMA